MATGRLDQDIIRKCVFMGLQKMATWRAAAAASERGSFPLPLIYETHLSLRLALRVSVRAQSPLILRLQQPTTRRKRGVTTTATMATAAAAATVCTATACAHAKRLLIYAHRQGI